jgi:hypothetical protein
VRGWRALPPSSSCSHKKAEAEPGSRGQLLLTHLALLIKMELTIVPLEPDPPPEGLNELEKTIAEYDLDTFKQLCSKIFVYGPGRNSPSKYGNCLAAAQEYNRIDMAGYLLIFGIKITDSFFRAAIKQKNYNFLEFYVNRGFDVNTMKPPVLL